MFLNRKVKTLLFIVVVSGGFAYLSLSTMSNAQTQNQNGQSGTPRIIRPSLAWASKPWAGDNQPYHEIRVLTDRLAEQGGLTLAALDKYRQAWSQQPRNPLVLFQWAYADNLAKRRYPSMASHMSPGDGAFQEPGLIDPQAYDYERVRFLLNWNGNEQTLLPLAKRLAAYDPRDFAVQYELAGLFSGTDTPAQKKASVMRVKRLLAQYPNKIGLYSLLGGIYCQHWLNKKNPADAQAAVSYYNKYLQLAPANDPWRKQASYWIDYIHNPPF